MLTQKEDVEAHALRQRSWSISAIARHLDRDRKTVRAYLNGIASRDGDGRRCLIRWQVGAGAPSWMAKHLDRVERLGGHLGPNLVQLPPRWTRNVDRLDEFLSAAPATIRWAVELRDPSWLHDDVFDVLRRHNAALCIHDLLASHPFELTTDWTYVRFHGPDALERPYHGSYGEARLSWWADRLGHLLDEGRDVYVYFNNDWHGHAVNDAAFLRERLVAQLTRRA